MLSWSYARIGSAIRVSTLVSCFHHCWWELELINTCGCCRAFWPENECWLYPFQWRQKPCVSGCQAGCLSSEACQYTLSLMHTVKLVQKRTNQFVFWNINTSWYCMLDEEMLTKISWYGDKWLHSSQNPLGINAVKGIIVVNYIYTLL